MLSLVVACNELLGNEPGVQVRDAPAEIPSGDPTKDEPEAFKRAITVDAGQDASSDGPSTAPVDAALACASGLADCNGRADDGCEADLQSTSSCGACGRACVAPPNMTPLCDGHACEYRCATGFGDCNQRPTDGCEVDLFADERNCGACGTFCIFGARCEGGNCIIRF